jgi:hypothetical protein
MLDHLSDQIASLFIAARRLCRIIARREFGELPLWIVPLSAIPAKLPIFDVLAGLASPILDIQLGDVIGQTCRCRGRAMILNDVYFVATFEPDFVPAVLLATAVHETCHLVDFPTQLDELDASNVSFESFVADYQALKADDYSKDKTNHWHGDRFIRTALHLTHRAAEAGTGISPALVCRNHERGLSSIWSYQSALGNEPARFADAKISDVLATPPPEEFSRLWASDLAHRDFNHLATEKSNE